LSLALLRTELEQDVAIRQVDAVVVSRVLGQVVGRHVEDPDAIAVAEGNVGDIIDAHFVYVIDRTPHRVQRGYRAVAKNRVPALLALEEVSIF